MTRIARVEYAVIITRIVGDERHFGFEHYTDGERFRTRRKAIAHGFKLADSDDFALGRLENGRLVDILWMYLSRGDTPEDIAEVAKQLSWGELTA